VRANPRHLPAAAASALFLVLLALHPHSTLARPHDSFSLGTVGTSVTPDRLLIAVSLENAGPGTAADLRIDSIRLDAVAALTPVPVEIGRLDSGQSTTVQADFASNELSAGKSYELSIRGSYRVGRGSDDDHEGVRADEPEKDNRHGKADDREDDRHEGHRFGFVAKAVVEVPPASPGQGTLGTVAVPPNVVSGGGYPPQPPTMESDVNSGAPPVPTGQFVPGVPTPTGTAATPAPFGDPPTVTFTVNQPLGLSGAGIGCSGDAAAACAEPSGAVTGGGVVFFSANWTAGYSTDGGHTFTLLNPTTIFPADAVGFCCDQIVQYVPSIDRFIWVLQGANFSGYHLAMASPATIVSSGGTAWTYWTLTPQLFGQPSGTGFDYPDLSVGNNSLYMSWDAGIPCPSGCTQGFQVARISLAGIQAGGTITIEFTHPGDGPSGVTWGDHLTQDTGDEIFWAGHDGNNQLRVFSLAEGSNTYFWRDVAISSWANNTLTSTTPDGRDWLAKNNNFPGNGVIGATRSGNQLWFAWSAGTDSNFQQAHVEMVTLDRANNFNPTQQVQIWNNSYAFSYPALATNACTGEVGLSFEYGGNGNYENHVVGFWGDFIAYITTGSDVGTDRFGDFVTIRQAPATQPNPGNLFAAFGFGVNQVPGGRGNNTDVHYVEFGRPASSCVVLQ
jgi:hypothetical protein